MRQLFILLIIMLVMAIPSQGLGLVTVDDADFTSEEVNDPQFLDSLCFLPVKFTKQEDGKLKAGFPGKNESVAVYFSLLPNNRGGFYKTGKTTNERITRDDFLKKYKSDIWWLVYRRIGEDNFIYSAYQIPNLLNLQGSYAYDPYDNYQRVDSYQFWQAMKLMTVTFDEFDKSANRATWYFLRFINKEKDPATFNELMTLNKNYAKALEKLKSEYPGRKIFPDEISKELGLPFDQIFTKSFNNQVIFKVVTNGTDVALIKRRDFFQISQYCVFTIDIGNGLEQPSDRNFFENNLNKYVWAVFYNPESKIALRMVALAGKPIQ